MNAIGRPLGWVGKTAMESLAGVGQVAGLCGRGFIGMFHRPLRLRAFLVQLLQIGTRSLPLTLTMAAFAGMVLAFQFGHGLERFGAKGYIGPMTMTALLRELSPILTALVVGGRIGAGIAAELGGMAVSEQIHAMRALGANPLQRLVAPRIVAAMIALPLLTICADVIGFFGGMAIAHWQFEVSPQLYKTSVFDFVTTGDFLSGVLKTVVFGFLIGAVACREGMRARGGTEGVGRATTRAVVAGALTVLGFNLLLTKLLLPL